MHDFLDEFEHRVLLTILALDNGVYGVPIREHLEERVGRNVVVVGRLADGVSLDQAELVMAFGLTGIVGFIMFDVNPRDPTVFGGINMLILLVGIVASVVPAVKATRVDPVVALRAR